VLTVQQLTQLDLFKSCQILKLIPLNSGLSHRLYQMTYIDVKNSFRNCVLRYLQSSIEDINNQKNTHYGTHEYNVMKLMYDLDIGPNTIDFLDITAAVGEPCSLIVMEFVDADLASNVTLNELSINQLSHHLSTIHGLDIKNVNIECLKLPLSPNSLTLLDSYWDKFTDKTTNNITRFSNINSALKDIKFNNNCLIHGDLNFTNILITNEKMTWIDWEYASIGDAYFDYATLCIESVDDIEERLIASLITNGCCIDRQRLALFKLYYAATCWLWTPTINAHVYINQRYRYELIVDKLLADI